MIFFEESFEEQNWTLFALEQYIQVLITSPLMVQETLLSVQYHQRSKDQDSEPNPVYIPPLQGDIAHDMKTIMNSKQEGFYSLFKGHFTQFCYSFLFSTIQPNLEQGINDILDVYEDTNPFTLVASHIVTGVVLSPLQLVRTRLITQSSISEKRTYYGLFHALFLIHKQEKQSPESNFLNTYYNPTILFPTILVSFIGPLIRYASICFIEKELDLDPIFNPIFYKMSQVICLGMEALIMQPLEVARKRLFAQRLLKSDSSLPLLDSCVETYQGSYTGILDCITCIVQQEGFQKQTPKKNLSTADWDSVYGGLEQKKTSFKGIGLGIKSLYRGFWARYTCMLIGFVTKEISSEQW